MPTPTPAPSLWRRILGFLPSAAVVTKYLTIVAIPSVVGGVTTWLLVHVKVLGNLGLSATTLASALTTAGIFIATQVVAALVQHHILKGTYAPASSVSADGYVRSGPRL